MYFRVAGAILASFLCSTPAIAATFNVSDAVQQSAYAGLDPLPGDIPWFSGGSDAGPLYEASGFQWTNPSAYGNDCTSARPDFSIKQYQLDDYYDHDSCSNNVAVSRADGAKFSVSSIDVDAQEYTRQAPATPLLPEDVRFLPFSSTYFERYFDDRFTALGVDPYSPEGQVLFAQFKAEKELESQAYDAWKQTSEYVKSDRFYVVGYRDGVEVASHIYADTSGRLSLGVTGFSNIDVIVFGFIDENNYLWDHYSGDFGGNAVLKPGQLWCDYACEDVNIYGFEYELAGGSVSGPDLAAVPVPAGLWFMGSIVGLLGWGARRRG